MTNSTNWLRQLARATNKQLSLLYEVARQKQKEGPEASPEWPQGMRQAVEKALRTLPPRGTLAEDVDWILVAIKPFITKIKDASFQEGMKTSRSDLGNQFILDNKTSCSLCGPKRTCGQC